jgi:hypothetical protein
MTLSPIFRSQKAKDLLDKYNHIFSLPLEIQIQTRRKINEMVSERVDLELQGEPLTLNRDNVLEEDFFLTLFNGIIARGTYRVDKYALANYFIRGMIVGGDDLADNETKSTLPIKKLESSIGQGLSQYTLSLQYLTESMHSIVENDTDQKKVMDELINKMRRIWSGMEETRNGEHILTPKELIRRKHEVVGADLFELGLVAPTYAETKTKSYFHTVRKGIREIGIAFQFVDDIVDFEQDRLSGEGNIVESFAYHKESFNERRALDEQLGDSAENPLTKFPESSRRAIKLAQEKVYKGISILRNEGFPIDPKDAPLFVQAIAGDLAAEDYISQNS